MCMYYRYYMHMIKKYDRRQPKLKYMDTCITVLTFNLDIWNHTNVALIPLNHNMNHLPVGINVSNSIMKYIKC